VDPLSQTPRSSSTFEARRKHIAVHDVLEVYFRRPPTPLKSSLELPKFSLPSETSDTHHPLKTAGIRGFWPRYARLETPTPQKSASGSQDPHLPTLLRILWSAV
jgi:hypothetical protein